MSDPILSQEEIDGLLEAIAEGHIDLESGEEISPDSVIRYDFREGYRSQQAMPTLEAVHQRFGTGLQGLLSGLIGRSTTVRVRTAVRLRYGEYLERMSERASLSLISLDPLVGYGVVVVGPDLISLVLNVLLGNPDGAVEKVRRKSLSPVEMRVARKVVETLLVAYRDAWEDVHPLTLGFVRTEEASLFTPVTAADDTVLVAAIDVTAAGHSDTLEIVLPDNSLDTVRDLLEQDFQITDPNAVHSFTEELMARLPQIDVEVRVEIGSMHLKLDDLLRFETGDVLTLPQSADAAVTAYVEDVPKFLGRTGSAAGTVAVEVTERLMEAC